MELIATTRLAFPRALVFRTYRDNLVETVPYLPSIASITAPERTDEGATTSLVNIWTAKTGIPSLARGSSRPTCWRGPTSRDGTRPRGRAFGGIETDAFPGLMECTGLTEPVEAGPQTNVRVTGTLVLHLEKAHVPRLLAGTVRALVEKLVATGLKSNLLSTGEGVERFLLSKCAP